VLFADVDIVKENEATGVTDLKIESLNAVSANALVNFMLFLLVLKKSFTILRMRVGV